MRPPLDGLMPEAQVLMLTVFEDSEQIFRALAAGASGYLLKRMSPKKLLEAIDEVCEGGSPMSAPIARKVVQSFKASAGARRQIGGTFPAENAVLDGLAEGLAYKQIADQLGVSIHTVRNYIRRIYEKLHVCYAHGGGGEIFAKNGNSMRTLPHERICVRSFSLPG